MKHNSFYIILSAVAALGMLLSACGAAATPTSAPAAAATQALAAPATVAPATAAPAAAAGAKKRILFINQQVGNPFWNVVEQGVNDACAKYNFQCDMQGPSDMDNPTMISDIEAGIATGNYQGMLIPAIVPDMFTPVINEAVAKGIAVIVFCTDAPKSNELAFVGTDPTAAGKAAGQLMAQLATQKLGGKANINVMSGQAAETDLNQRIQGFESALSSNMKVVSTDYGENGIKDTISKLDAELVAHPEINAFFGAMADGGDAIMSEYPTYKAQIDKDVVIGFDDNPETLQGIKQGVIAATIVQRQYNWGFGSVYMLHRLWDEKLPLPKFTDTGSLTVTQANLATYAQDTKNPQMFLDMEPGAATATPTP